MLTILCSVPFFNYENYFKEPDAYSYTLQLLSKFETNSPAFIATFDSFMSTSTENVDTPVIFINADGYSWQSPVIKSSDLRPIEKEINSFVVENSNADYLAVYDLRKITKLEAMLGIGTTFLVCFVLAAGSLALSRITIDLVITPIEAMMDKVKRISENPLKAAAEEENEQLAIEEQERLLGKQPRKE